MSVRIYGVCTVYMITTKPGQRVCNTKGPVVVQGKENIMLKIKKMLTNKKVLVKAAKTAHLNRVPEIEFKGGNYMMAALSCYKARGTWFHKVYTETWSEYRVLVNHDAVMRLYKRISCMCMNPKAGYDAVYGILLHEFRHCYQAQSGFMVGRVVDENGFNSLFEGHGSNMQEIDANDFMVENASNERQKLLFKFLRLEQSSDGLSKGFDSEFKKEMYETALKAIKAYNPVMYWVVSFLNSEIRFPFRVGEKK